MDTHVKCNGSGDGVGHNPYWYRHADQKVNSGDAMADLATLHTRHTNTQVGTLTGAPYNSHTDFQFQFESDVGLGLVGNSQDPAGASGKSTRDLQKQSAGKKGKDTLWGSGKQSSRPGTGRSSKQQRPGTAGSNFGETSLNWYPDLGYEFDPEGTSHTADGELEMDVAAGSSSCTYHPTDKRQQRQQSQAANGKGHANEHTRHSSATVPSEYIGTSPRSPQFIYYENEDPARSLPQLVSSLSPVPLLPKETANSRPKPNAEINTYGNSGYTFPPAPSQPHAHAPVVGSRLYVEHRARSSTDTSASASNPNDSQPYLPAHTADFEGEQRDSIDGEGGLPAYYLRQHSHKYMHSTDYRSSADSSIGVGARAAINSHAHNNNAVRGGDPRAGVCVGAGPGPTKLYDSDYPYTVDYTHGNMSAVELSHYAPPPKSAFEREGGGFQLISGRKRTGEGSGDSFQTNPSLYGGRGY
jgi:hypothetical protein